MEESGKRRFAAIMLAVAGLAYFFLAARPLSKALVLEPRWAHALDAAPALAAPTAAGAPSATKTQSALRLDFGAGSGIPYRIAGRYGYFDPESGPVFAAPEGFGVALSPGAYIAYDRLPESLELRAPDGTVAQRIAEPGYPFFAAGRLFLLAPGQCAVSELDSDGRVLWSRGFSSVITAFSASPALAVFGLMDGQIVGIGRGGEELLAFSPGGSRIAGIYGCAVSADGSLVAAISGIDRQRLVVLERRSSAYRVTYHRWLESDFRRSVAMAFTEDGRYLFYEAPTGLGIYNCDARREALLAAEPLSSLGAYAPERDLLLALERGQATTRLVAASPEGRRLYTAPFAAADAFLVRRGDALFLGVAESADSASILRLDFKEE